MSIYDRQIAQAKRKIKKKGELCTWIANSAVSADPSKPWNTSPAVPADPPVDPPKVYIVFTQPGVKLESLFNLIKGTSVPTGAPSGLMAQVPFVPAINDTVVRKSGEKLEIKDFNVVAPNGDVILYKLDFA